jgi:hypothetical protein
VTVVGTVLGVREIKLVVRQDAITSVLEDTVADPDPFVTVIVCPASVTAEKSR